LRKITLNPGEQRELAIRFEISPKVKAGEKLYFPLEVKRLSPGRRTMGGVSFTVEAAEGRLQGRLVNREKIVPKQGTVTIKNIKQTNLKYSTTVGRMGSFSFPNIVPGPYRIYAECGKLTGEGSVFVEPNRVTTKVLSIEFVRKLRGMKKEV
jgi:hypothetical protein